jgi:DNA-directed RNA polymerase subunit L
MIASNENENSIEYTLENEDYTIGNVLNHLLFKNYFEDNQTITFCGFKKLHPHDTDGIIRIMFKDSENSSSSSSSSKSKSKLRTSSSMGPPPLDTPPYATVEKVSPGYKDESNNSSAEKVSPGYKDESKNSSAEKVSPGYKDESNNSSAEKVSTGYASPGYASSSSETKGGGSTFQKIGFDYIKNCCNDAIEIFKKIEQSFINKKD